MAAAEAEKKARKKVIAETILTAVGANDSSRGAAGAPQEAGVESIGV